MEIIIDIPEEAYKSIVKGNGIQIYYGERLVAEDTWASEIIKKGTPLPKGKTGHWIGTKRIGLGEWQECFVPLNNGIVSDSCHCSECGEWLTGSDEYQCYGNYCPKCGAKMAESEKK